MADYGTARLEATDFAFHAPEVTANYQPSFGGVPLASDVRNPNIWEPPPPPSEGQLWPRGDYMPYT